MTLHAPVNHHSPWHLAPWQQSHSVQTGTPLAPATIPKSPSSPASIGSKNSYQSPGQMSPGQAMYPWYQQGHSIAREGNMVQGQSQGYLSPGQISRSSHSPLAALVDKDETAEENLNAGSTNIVEGQKSKVAFSLTDSSSSKSTESGFSEHVTNPAETYASVCTKCKGALDKLGNHGNKGHASASTVRNRTREDDFTSRDQTRIRSWSDAGGRGRGQRSRGQGSRGHRYHSGDHDNRGYEGRNRSDSWNADARHKIKKNSPEKDNTHKRFHERTNDNHRGRGQGRFPSRGQRGHYQGHRYSQYRYESESKGPSSEPVLEREVSQGNGPVRRTVSSPDKTYDKEYTHFRFSTGDYTSAHKEEYADRMKPDSSDNDQVNSCSDLTFKMTINDSGVALEQVDQTVSPNKSDSLQEGNNNGKQSSDADWTSVDHRKKKHLTGYHNSYSYRRDYDSDFKRNRGHSQRSSRYEGNFERDSASGRGRGSYRGRGSQTGSHF